MVDVPQDNKWKELLELTRENNKMLKKIRHGQILSNVMRLIYWLIILGVLFGSFYFLQPFFTQVTDIYQGLLGTSEALEGVSGGISGIGDLGELLGGLSGE